MQTQFILVVLLVVGLFYILDHTLYYNRDYAAYVSDMKLVYEPLLMGKKQKQPNAG